MIGSLYRCKGKVGPRFEGAGETSCIGAKGPLPLISPTLVRLKLMMGSLYRSSYLINVGSITTTGAGTLQGHHRQRQGTPQRYPLRTDTCSALKKTSGIPQGHTTGAGTQQGHLSQPQRDAPPSLSAGGSTSGRKAPSAKRGGGGVDCSLGGELHGESDLVGLLEGHRARRELYRHERLLEEKGQHSGGAAHVVHLRNHSSTTESSPKRVKPRVNELTALSQWATTAQQRASQSKTSITLSRVSTV